MQVPFLDLKAQLSSIRAEVLAEVEQVLDSTRFILGEEVTRFEAEFAAYVGTRFAVGVASGLDALKLSLRAAGVGPGDEVITAANTFIATAFAISSAGAQPVLADADPVTCNLAPDAAAAAVTPRTRAIIPVHLYGQPAAIDPLRRLAAGKGIVLIEDASQSHGARYRGRRTGSLADAAAFSLYPGKNLGACGDAGIVTTDSETVATTVRTLRNYGSSAKYHHELMGENSRLDTLQAAILRVKLRHLDAWNSRRRAIAALYSERLAGVGDLVLPAAVPETEPVFHLYVVRTASRDHLARHLKDRGVECLIHYPIPIHLQPAYRSQGWREGQFPVTEQIARQVLSLPVYPELTPEQADTVVQAVREFFG